MMTPPPPSLVMTGYACVLNAVQTGAPSLCHWALAGGAELARARETKSQNRGARWRRMRTSQVAQAGGTRDGCGPLVRAPILSFARLDGGLEQLVVESWISG